MSKIVRLVLMTLLIPLIGGCGHPDYPGSDDEIITVSIPPQAYLVERVAGSEVRVLTLVQGGESPATYQPSDRQVSEVMRSRVYFRIGLPFEQGRWLDAIQSSGSGMQIVDLREGAVLRHFGEGPSPCEGGHGAAECAHGHDHGPGTVDPHIWLSPANLKILAGTVARTLGELYPDLSARFQNNLQALIRDIDQVHEEVREVLSSHAGSRIYIYHPAWGYFCDTYGLEQVAIEFEGKEPAEEELTRIQEQMRSDRAKVIFVQPQIEGKSVMPVARAVGAEVKILDPLARDVVENLRLAAKAVADSYQ
jgi:zinc transport system substrate-binding protein